MILKSNVTLHSQYFQLTVERISVWIVQLFRPQRVLARLDRVIPLILDQLDQREIVRGYGFISGQYQKNFLLFQGVQIVRCQHVHRFSGVRQFHQKNYRPYSHEYSHIWKKKKKKKKR